MLGPGLSALTDHCPANLIVKLGQPAEEVARKVKAFYGRDAGRA